MSSDDSFSNHKLCGFLCAVLTVNPHQPSAIPSFKESLEIFRGNGTQVGFRSQNGVVLSPVDLAFPKPNSDSEQCEDSGAGSSSRVRRMRKVGMVNGSMSVVHQIHALVSRNCLKVDARVVWVEVRGSGGEARAVVLVDVYLPIELWSGWQFPKSRAVAGALFHHLRFASMTVLDFN